MMKRKPFLLLLFIPFLNFAQESENQDWPSLELGYKIFGASTSSDELQDSGWSGYNLNYYKVDKNQIIGQQGHLQLNYNFDRITALVGLGYIRLNEEMQGQEHGVVYLNTPNPQSYASSFTFKRHSDYGTLFAGYGVSFFRNQRKCFFGPIARIHYTYLFQSEITQNESTYAQYGVKATDYITIGKEIKHSLRPSVGLLFRFNTEFGLQINIEAGYNRLDNNAVTFNSIKRIVGSTYAQMSIGYNFRKLAKR